ncbi:hypothetical protein ACFW23_02320 [Streptomyces rochei]|uniref:hypothetical protein n=1 Tax=Streptomyces rochei TaxID=1928 RepID=UPI003675051A
MLNVKWREAEEKQDAQALAAFVCGIPAPPSRRPPQWEREVERYFRLGEVWEDLKTSKYSGQRFLIAEDSEGIAAAFTHARLVSNDQALMSPAGEARRMLMMLGIAARTRQQGHRFGNQVLEEALYDILDSEPDSSCVHVWGKVRPKNLPSQRMLKRAGFEERDVPSLGNFTHWYLVLER